MFVKGAINRDLNVFGIMQTITTRKHKDHYNNAYIVELSQKILSIMPEFEAQKFVQKSVGNNLNDLFKESPQKAQTLIAQW